MSVINYRFQSLKNFSKITFEGAGLQGWELKSEIISQKQMLSEDFDLQLFEPETNLEISEDQMVYRNSSVVVKRIPLWMAKARPPRERQSIKQKKGFKQPPPNYTCFRCGQKGHYIQFCPTNNDRSYDIVRLRNPTGIPKAFLVPTSSEEIPEAASKLVTNEGLVQVQPQTQEWNRMRGSIRKAVPNRLVCSVCNSVYEYPVRTSCDHNFCDRCIEIGDPCPTCGADVVSKAKDTALGREARAFRSS